ncbi:hypothetical protein BDZ45DRAFT_480912 [Acephala macrosclerotiorum]|nr:hypothetical protein BDZ45DRAFT_480912 [Acephala macrosclerotiorum]
MTSSLPHSHPRVQSIHHHRRTPPRTFNSAPHPSNIQYPISAKDLTTMSPSPQHILDLHLQLDLIGSVEYRPHAAYYVCTLSSAAFSLSHILAEKESLLLISR